MPKLTLMFMLSLSLISLNCVATEQLIDPTQPPGYSSRALKQMTLPKQTVSTPSKAQLELNSTMVSPSYKMAIINGVQFRIGDRTSDGLIIKSIGEQQVKLQNEKGKIITLTIQKSFIRNLTSNNAK